MTVSRVINRDPRVSAGTAGMVRAAMNQLGFIPRPASDGRRSGSRARRGLHTGRIAVFFPDPNLAAIHTALSMRLLDGIDRRLQGPRLQLIIARLAESGRLPDCIDPRQIDGVIVRSGSTGVDTTIAGLPTVRTFESTAQPDCDQVIPDSELIGRWALERLVLRGCRRVVVVDDSPAHPAHRLRIAAFLAHLAKTSLRAETIAVETRDPAALRDRIAALLERKPALDGMFMPGTGTVVSVAVQAIVEAQRRERKRAIAVVACCHDRDLLAGLPRAIDNLDIAPEAIGAGAVELLLQRIAEPDAPLRTLTISPIMSDP